MGLIDNSKKLTKLQTPFPIPMPLCRTVVQHPDPSTAWTLLRGLIELVIPRQPGWVRGWP